MIRKWLILPALLLILTAFQTIPQAPEADHEVHLPLVLNNAMFGAPALKWAYGGCYSSWCETGWYSSPAVADVDGDGIDEVIASAYSVTALEGENGGQIWRVGGTNNRTWPGIVIADLERDGIKDIVVAQGGGLVSAYRFDGTLKWQRQPAGNSNELRGLLVSDLNANNGSMEVVVTRAAGSGVNTWVLDAAGNTRPGWPQRQASTPGYSWGVYNANAAAGSFTGDARLELVVPSDVHYIQAYTLDGAPLPANPVAYPGKVWGEVGVWESLATETRGWGECNGVRAESYRTNFADGPAAIADLNGDGVREVIVTGNMYNCIPGYPSQYTAVFVFNFDRTRFHVFGYDWSQAPTDTGAPLSQDYDLIETAQPNPAIADLDGDGQKEILFASYDGRVHAFWLDKSEHDAWPYAVTKPGEGFIRFASEPLVVDLNADGEAEVIFTSWTQKTSGQPGKLHILNRSGEPVYEVNLPAPKSTSVHWNGGLGAPTIANVDADADYELVILTANSGVVVYDLPNSAAALIHWGTGRGGFLRTAAR